MTIAFLWHCPVQWQYQKWQDGLSAALAILEQRHDIHYILDLHDPASVVRRVRSIQPDVVVCWGPFHDNWDAVLPFVDARKLLCFANGAPDHENRTLFDAVLVESQEWYDRIRDENGVAVRRAFGTNTDVFYPLNAPVQWNAVYPATFALWKRHHLFAQLGPGNLAVGRKQGFENECHDVCYNAGQDVMDMAMPPVINQLYSMSRTCVITSDYWGGSQRTALEAMACHLPVFTLSDGKCAEYVRDSGCGAVRDTMDELVGVWNDYLASPWDMPSPREYILRTYTQQHYADALEAAFYAE